MLSNAKGGYCLLDWKARFRALQFWCEYSWLQKSASKGNPASQGGIGLRILLLRICILHKPVYNNSTTTIPRVLVSKNHAEFLSSAEVSTNTAILSLMFAITGSRHETVT